MRNVIRGHQRAFKRGATVILARIRAAARLPARGCLLQARQRGARDEAVIEGGLHALGAVGGKVERLMTEALSGAWSHSEAIMGYQSQSEVISRYWRSSVAIGGHQWRSVVISGDRWSSVAIGGYQSLSEVISRKRRLSVAISGHQSEAIMVRQRTADEKTSASPG